MRKALFETARLILRELEPSDFNDLAEIMRDGEVKRVYEHIFTDEDIYEWLNRQTDRYRRYGFGLWAAELKESGEIIGQAGLTIQLCDDTEVLEIGYLLKEKFRHKGFATEAAKGCMLYAFKKLDSNKVYSIIKKDNLPSIRVAKRLGMKIEKEFTARYYNGDMPHYLFSAEREGNTLWK